MEMKEKSVSVLCIGNESKYSAQLSPHIALPLTALIEEFRAQGHLVLPNMKH